jgi:hypothetical protein
MPRKEADLDLQAGCSFEPSSMIAVLMTAHDADFINQMVSRYRTDLLNNDGAAILANGF